MGNHVSQNVSSSFFCDPERIYIFAFIIYIGLASIYYNSLGTVITNTIITGDYISQENVI